MQRFLCIVLVLIIGCLQPSFANSDKKSNDNSVAEVVEDFYEAWNEHDLEKLFTYYSRNFITGDGITREDYKELTQVLWDSYPDIKIENQKKTIRSQDQYATISGIDLFKASSKEANKDIGVKGRLSAISQGQLFLKKYGKHWKIESDRIFFELVSVNFGNAKEYLDEHQVYFSTPEQIRAGEEYSGTLYFALPENVQATATINRELIVPPKDNQEAEESYQNVSEHKLERLFMANSSNHNELVSATVVLSKGIIEPKLDGVLYISKRVNVLPETKDIKASLPVKYAFAKKVQAKEAKQEETKQVSLDADTVK